MKRNPVTAYFDEMEPYYPAQPTQKDAANGSRLPCNKKKDADLQKSIQDQEEENRKKESEAFQKRCHQMVVMETERMDRRKLALKKAYDVDCTVTSSGVVMESMPILETAEQQEILMLKEELEKERRLHNSTKLRMTQSQATNDQLMDELRAQSTKTNQEIDLLKSKAVQSSVDTSKLLEKDAEIDRLTRKVQQLEKAVKRQTETIYGMDQKMKSVTAEQQVTVEESKAEIKKLNESLIDLELDNDELRHRFYLERTHDCIIAKDKNTKELERTIAQKDLQVDLLEFRNADLVRLNDTLYSNLRKKEMEIQEKRLALVDRNNEIEKLKKQVEKDETQYEILKQNVQIAERLLGEGDQEVKDLKGRLQEREDSIKTMGEMICQIRQSMGSMKLA